MKRFGLGDRRLWRRVIALLREANGQLTLMGVVLTFAEVAFGIAVFYAIKLLIDALTTELSDGSDAGDRLFISLGFAVAALVALVIVQALAGYVRTAQGIAVGEVVDRAIHDRAVNVDLGFYESPAYFDSLQRARQAGTQRPAQVVSGLLLAVKAVMFLVAILAMIGSIDWRVLPFIMLAVAAVLVVRLRFTQALFVWQRQRTALERKAAYLDWLITSEHHAKELRIGALGQHLRDAYSDVRAEVNTVHMQIERRRAWAELAVAGLGALVFAGATVYLVFETLAGVQTVGNLVLFVLLFRRAEASGREFVQHTAKLYDDQLYLKQLFDFLEVQPQVVAPATPLAMPAPIREGLRFKAVSFHYPGNPKPALADIDLVLPPGKVVALVGENGSGKTSLIKLLTRLYDPDAGEITLDGINIRSFDPADYRRLFSVVFQDYARYAASLSDNIAFGDVQRRDQRAAIEAAAAKAGATGMVADLRHGYDTLLSRMFDDGQELSLGQWQRVALARALFAQSQFLILDEPSSALDPQAEFELFEDFRACIGDRGALVISHRLSTVRLADYTYVLENGRIAEAGTHDDLVQLGGRYAELFEMQGRRYRG